MTSLFVFHINVWTNLKDFWKPLYQHNITSIGILCGNKYSQNVHNLLSNIYSNVKQDNTKSVLAFDFVFVSNAPLELGM
jgi:hypothetical protein